ncbi:MAG: outer membrane protein transport protein [Proteobacteria bacterium]|nr:outer membrane protein transport protein [Pseudomonadota bacterium]
MSVIKTKTLIAAAVLVSGAAILAQPAYATEGYFQHGYGTAAKGMAGAGVAAPQDTQAAVNNPAGMRGLGNRVDGALSLFSPIRQYDAKRAEVFIADKDHESESNIFLVPSLGASWDMGSYSLGLTLSANGGMNTDYDSKVFAGGTDPRTGVDLTQAFIGATYAVELNKSNTIGITPTFAMQRFAAKGLQGFASISSDSANLTNRGHDFFWGGGVRVGWLNRTTDKLTLGLTAQSRMWMTKLDKYKGLFAEQGGFDIPPAVTVGGSYKATDKLTINADYKRIFYSTVDSIANTLTNVRPFHTGAGGTANANSLGGDNGVGFGWQDVNIFKLGGQYVYSDALTLRAGVAHNTDPFEGTETLFNILAPAVVNTHLSVGATYSISPAMNLNFAFTHAFAADITGANVNHASVTALGGSGTAHQIELEMYQNDLEIGLTYKF